MLRPLTSILCAALVFLGSRGVRAQDTAPVAPAPVGTVEGAALAPASQPAVDPFVRLRVVVPRDRLPPLASVRVRDRREAADLDRKGKTNISVGSSPAGAAVYYGGRPLGTTPLYLAADRGSTPFDVVIRAKGYMTLRTRIRRKEDRSYFFKLTPAKIR